MTTQAVYEKVLLRQIAEKTGVSEEIILYAQHCVKTAGLNAEHIRHAQQRAESLGMSLIDVARAAAEKSELASFIFGEIT